MKPFIAVQLDPPDGYFLPLSSKGQKNITVESAIIGQKAGGPGFSEASALFTPFLFGKRNESELHTYLLVASFDGVVYSVASVPKPHFKETNMWVGADGCGLIASRGLPCEAHKKRLFALKEGESILFCDAHKEVTRITAGACGQSPTLVRATDEEVAEYVLGEARRRGEIQSTRDWCFHALKELGVLATLDSFRSLFPAYKGR